VLQGRELVLGRNCRGLRAWEAGGRGEGGGLEPLHYSGPGEALLSTLLLTMTHACYWVTTVCRN
jgi:hypothetical protein